MPWWLLYGLLTAGALSTTWRDRRRSGDALGAAILLSGLWVLWNLAHALHAHHQLYSLLDLIACVGCAWIWRLRLEPWKVGLILLFLTDLYLHAHYVAVHDWSHAAKVRYDLAQNATYLGQLACVVTPSVICRLRARRTPTSD